MLPNSTVTTSISPRIEISYYERRAEVCLDMALFADVDSRPDLKAHFERLIALTFERNRLHRAPSQFELEEYSGPLQGVGEVSWCAHLPKKKALNVAQAVEELARDWKRQIEATH